MVMVILPAARRHHRSRTLYAFGLLALLGAVTTLVMVVRYPALSATELSAPVPAPEITVVDEGTGPGPGWADRDPQAGAQGAPARAVGVPGPAGAGAGDGTDTVVEARRAPGGATERRDDVSRSLFWSGVIGLAISLAGLGLVGTRRRRW
ncbi:hypothetical protein [Micromonospora rubida]|uniref:hypothetical protein n=1 Tax=Micromonospora rubida TaxID=2697657 RepID=UPI001376DE1E|nr:hypothetical protein [Micromonospora rubida]NBE82379.1 hypothetical protein [Micromonospora rubida]